MSFNIPAFQNPSVMKHDFSKVPHADIPRSAFRRSHGHKTTFDAGWLTPIYVDEALPGDTFALKMSSVVRMPTLLKPMMDNLYLDYFFFFVPNRLLWDNWQKFCGEQVDPGDSIDYTVPTISPAATVAAGTLGDYFGIPVGITGLTFSSLHFRAYNLIYNEWFRDQNLQDSVVVDTDDGPDAEGDYVMLRRGKRHDYFTSCLPWPQKGTAVDLPLGTTAPVIGSASDRTWAAGDVGMRMWDIADGTYKGFSHLMGATATTGTVASSSDSFVPDEDLSPSNLVADLSGATAATINDLREAFQIQKLMERDARGGTRYTEILRSHFRVSSPDQRLQRPEYLGGGSRRMEIEPIPDTGSTPGRLLAQGWSNQSGIGFTKSFVEHGVILGIANLRADITYQDGLNRMWSRSTRYDFYWPALAHIGEQAVLQQEIKATGVDVTDEAAFGYQERWAEYRYKPSYVSNQFRSNHGTSLDYWHLALDLGGAPALNATFIVDDPPVDRVVSVPSEPHCFADFFFDVVTTRPMPMYSVPGMIDHF